MRDRSVPRPKRPPVWLAEDRAEDRSEKQRHLQDLAARLLRTISVARALVHNGRTLNLAGLDDGVGMLCAQALDLPRASGQAMLAQLQDVRAGLDDLTAALRQVHGDGDPPGPAF